MFVAPRFTGKLQSALASSLAPCHLAAVICVMWLQKMSAVEPPGAQDSVNRTAPPSMPRPSIQMGAGGLPSAAEIWSTGAEASAPPDKPAEQIATEKLFYGPEPAAAARVGTL